MKKTFILALLSILLVGCTGNETGQNPVKNTSTNSTNSTVTQEDSPKDFCTETASKSIRLPAGDVLALAKEEDGYSFTEKQDAELIPVDNNQSFAVWWEPENFDASTGTVVVSLHGHGAWATKDFEVWYPELKKYNVAYLGLQWWFGRSLENEGYYEPDQIYRLIAEELKTKGISAGHVIFQGFSMGGARSYGVALYDKSCGNNYFGISIANAGPWEDSYPLYKDILTEDYGEKPFEDTRWILFCGDEDENENSQYGTTHVCTGMENTQDTLERLGASVELFIKDPVGDHGSFMMNKDNVEEAMDEAVTWVRD